MILFLFVSLVGVVCASQDPAMNDTTLMKTSNEISSSLSSDGGVDKLGATEDEEILKADWVVSGNTFGDIQTAINNAGNGDTIYLGGQTFTASGSAINVNKNVIICGGTSDSPTSRSTLNGNNGNVIFTLSASGIILNNINFINADSGSNIDGGAVNIQASDCTISDCSFDNCKSTKGGAIYISSSGSNTKMENCEFTNNEAKWSNNGGAVYMEASNCQFTNCNFEKNSAVYGGAIQVASGGNLVFDGCNFTENTAQSYAWGGAINFDGNGETFTITNSKFKKNTGGNGGAIHAGRPYLTLDNCEFEENKNTNGNTAGGAVDIAHDHATITNCNFTSNSATSGGAIGIDDGCYFADMSNCIFKDNTATTGTAIYAAGDGNGTVTNCDLGGTKGLDVTNEQSTLTVTLSNDLTNIVVGNIEGTISGKNPLPNETVNLEIYNSGTLIRNYSGKTDQNGQFSKDYSDIPVGDYTYDAYYMDGDSKIEKTGPLYNFVSGDTFQDIQNAINSASPGDVIYLK